MDSEQGDGRRPGGTLEPTSWRAISDRVHGGREIPIIDRYELRDPFEEVTYRTKTLPEMALQAERLGALRFHGVTVEGKRVPIERWNGEWSQADRDELQSSPTSKPVDERHAEAAPRARTATSSAPVLAHNEEEAARAARIERLEHELVERYIIKRASVKIGAVTIGQTEYRFRGDTARIAFTESMVRLATDSNSPSVARSMVDVAEARHWQAVRVAGHEDFRRMVWLQASVRGITIAGYEPTPADHELVHKERDLRQVNRVELGEAGQRAGDAGGVTKASGRGRGGRKAVLAALEAVLIARSVPPRQMEAVMSAAAENLAARVRQGEVHKIKILDKSAPTQRQVTRRPREVQRTQDRPSPSRQL